MYSIEKKNVNEDRVGTFLMKYLVFLPSSFGSVTKIVKTINYPNKENFPVFSCIWMSSSNDAANYNFF